MYKLFAGLILSILFNCSSFTQQQASDSLKSKWSLSTSGYYNSFPVRKILSQQWSRK
jgi:hypothetical protein